MILGSRFLKFIFNRFSRRWNRFKIWKLWRPCARCGFFASTCHAFSDQSVEFPQRINTDQQ